MKVIRGGKLDIAGWIWVGDSYTQNLRSIGIHPAWAEDALRKVASGTMPIADAAAELVRGGCGIEFTHELLQAVTDETKDAEIADVLKALNKKLYRGERP